jgi:hypothetical protein
MTKNAGSASGSVIHKYGFEDAIRIRILTKMSRILSTAISYATLHWSENKKGGAAVGPNVPYHGFLR